MLIPSHVLHSWPRRATATMRSLSSCAGPAPWSQPIASSWRSSVASRPHAAAWRRSWRASIPWQRKKGALTMGRRSPSPAWKTFDASARKSFHSALCHLLQTEFPGVFGPAITKLFAEKIDDLYACFLPPSSHFRVGQVLWAAVAVDDLPGRNKRIENTRLVPVILDLVSG